MDSNNNLEIIHKVINSSPVEEEDIEEGIAEVIEVVALVVMEDKDRLLMKTKAEVDSEVAEAAVASRSQTLLAETSKMETASTATSVDSHIQTKIQAKTFLK